MNSYLGNIALDWLFVENTSADDISGTTVLPVIAYNTYASLVLDTRRDYLGYRTESLQRQQYRTRVQ